MINDRTRKLIVDFEGLRTTAYQDSVGVWTIGVGHTSAAGDPKVSKGMTITEDQAYKILDGDLADTEAQVQKAVKVSLNPNQYGALVSWTFNLGPGNLNSSTMLKKINVKDFKGAADEMLKWDNAGGRKLPGLTRRRVAERALFLSPVESDSPSVAPEPQAVPETSVAPVPAPKKGLLDVLFELLVNLFKR